MQGPWERYGGGTGTSVQTRPVDPTLPTRQAILAEQLRHERMTNRELSDRLGPEQSAADSNLTGHDYFATLPPADQRMVRALIEGRIQMPVGRAMNQGNWPRWIQQAQQVDPGLDAANARTRYTTRREYTSGLQSRNVIALNTALGHINSMQDAADALDNGHWPLVNAARNVLRDYPLSGDPRLNNFRERRQALASELRKVFTVTGGGSLQELQAWESSFNGAQSPEQLRGALETAADLLNSRIHAVADSYDRAMGRSDAHMDWLSPSAGETMSRYGFPEWGGGGAPSPQAQPPGAAPPGEQPDRTLPTVTAEGAGQNLALSHGGEQADPAHAAIVAQAQRRFSHMLTSGRPDAEVAAYGQAIHANPADVARALAWRRGERVPGVNGTWREWRRQRPNEQYPMRDESLNVPMTPLASTAAAAASSGPATGLVNAADAVFPLSLSGAALGLPTEPTRLGLEATGAEHPNWALGGRLAGATAAYAGGGKLADMAGGALETSMPRLSALLRGEALPGGTAVRSPTTAPAFNAFNPRSMAGDALYGAVQGTGENGDPLSGAAENVAGGMFGRKLARGAGRAFTGSRDAATRFLTAHGVPLTLGQISGQGGIPGKIIRAIENRSSGIHPMIDTQYRRGLEGFNRAAFNESVTPVQGNPVGNLLGEDALANVRRQRSDAYTNALAGRMFSADPPAIAGIRSARIAARDLPNSANEFNYTLGQNVDPLLEQPGGISGEDFQTSIRALRRGRTRGMNDPNRFDAHDLGQRFGEVEDALTGMVNRQAPDVVPALNAANQTNRMVSTLGEAVRGGQANVEGGNPVFTPFRLNAASIANTTKYGGRDAAISTSRPFFELSRAGQEILPNRVPDTGSGSRALLPLLGASVLGGGGAATDATGYTDHAARNGMLIAGGLTLPYSNAGRWAIQKALVGRPEWSRQAGEFILTHPEFARRLGMFAGTATGYESGRQ